MQEATAPQPVVPPLDCMGNATGNATDAMVVGSVPAVSANNTLLHAPLMHLGTGWCYVDKEGAPQVRCSRRTATAMMGHVGICGVVAARSRNWLSRIRPQPGANATAGWRCLMPPARCWCLVLLFSCWGELPNAICGQCRVCAPFRVGTRLAGLRHVCSVVAPACDSAATCAHTHMLPCTHIQCSHALTNMLLCTHPRVWVPCRDLAPTMSLSVCTQRGCFPSLPVSLIPG